MPGGELGGGRGHSEDEGSEGGESDPDAEHLESGEAGQACIISKMGLPVAKLTEAEWLLAKEGLIRGPLGVLKHAGQTGLRVVGLETSGPPETGAE
jgi:hypothetical protein